VLALALLCCKLVNLYLTANARKLSVGSSPGSTGHVQRTISVQGSGVGYIAVLYCAAMLCCELPWVFSACAFCPHYAVLCYAVLWCHADAIRDHQEDFEKARTRLREHYDLKDLAVRQAAEPLYSDQRCAVG
jgi:hypothetical protein